MNENVIAKRHVARIVGPFWNRRVVLVLQVQDKRDGPFDHRGLPAWLGPFWRDANTSDLTVEGLT